MKIIPNLLGALVMLISFALRAQNLIKNGSFEEHGDQKCLECNTLYGQYPALVYNWDNGGWGCQLLDKNYKRSSDDNKWKGNPFDRLSPVDGKAMIEMWYMPGCGGKEYMCASYLSAHTTQALQVGKLYEASFWLYIEGSKRSDPDRASHIGVVLMPQNIEYRVAGGGKRLLLPFLPIDTVRYDEWYQVKWRVRPLCTSNYFVIGLFADQQWPKSRSFDDLIYYVDKVLLKEMPSPSAIADSSIYYCSRYAPETLGAMPKMDNQTLLFENDAFDLTAEHKAALDSFAVFAQKNPDLIFELSGHTDSIGTQNLALSQNRVQSVAKYLTDERKLPSYRFITLSMGGKNPFRPNRTEEGRRLNRRVEIRQSPLSPSKIFYRKALQAVEAQHYAEAFSWLSKWRIKPREEEDGDRIILLFDPRLAVLRKDIRWSMVDKKITKEYSKFKYPRYTFLLDSMRLDESSATAWLTMMGYRGGLNALPGYIPELDTLFFEMEPLPDEIIQKKYKEHFAMLRTILDKTGWPKQSEFGENTCAGAFNMLLNSKEIVEYLKWLPVIQKTCEDGEAPWIYYARLYDHCNLALGRPQRYLTVVRVLETGEAWIEGSWEGTEDTINEYRAKIGLPLLSSGVVAAMEKQK